MPARILLIEDNRDNLELMAYLLRASGYIPLSAGSGEAGLGVARVTESPDLIICDIMLPRMSGFEVARELKADPFLKGVPIIAVSAVLSRPGCETVLAAGFDGFIPMPIVPETFVEQISAFLRPDLRSTSAPPAAHANLPWTMEPSPGQADATILAVDDRAVNLELARSVLEPFGYKVLTAVGVNEALKSARKNLPDLILTDVHMGDGDGFDLVRMIKMDEQLKHTPCILISASYLNVDPRAKALDMGAAEFILRPVEPQILLAKIAACLQRQPVASQPETKTGDSSEEGYSAPRLRE